MNKELSQEQIDKRFAEIDALPPEQPTAADLTAIAAAEAEDTAQAVGLEEYRSSLEEYSGKLVIRIPRSLHKELKAAAEIEGVSLNQYMLYKLAK